MKSQHYNIVIVGGGMVGASLALCLSRQLQPDTRILMVESFPLPDSSTDLEQRYSPSFDARSTALSHSTRVIYERLGIWAQLESRLCAIDSIHVSDRGQPGSALLQAEDSGMEALGYVVENAWLGQVLIRQLQVEGDVELASPATVSKVIPIKGGVSVELNKDEQAHSITTDLLVVADGANSGLRKQLGIAASVRDYRQKALITNVSFDKPHGNRAFERFTDQGPMAVLPLLNDAAGQHRASLVWTLDHEQAEALQCCDESEFLAQLTERFGSRLGAFTRVGERFSYPLSLVEASEQVRSHVVVMGNAAHSLHPVAGQGFNLALRDVAHLSAALTAAQSSMNDVNLGTLNILNSYLDGQRKDQQLTVGFSDRVVELFSNRHLVLTASRSGGLLALDLVPELKSLFVHHATGQAGLRNWANNRGNLANG